MINSLQFIFALLCVIFGVANARPGYLLYSDIATGGGTIPYTVTYDNRSLIVAGNRTVFASAGIHYPRFTPGQWDDVILKAKNDGYNMIQTYFFVNAHMPKSSVWPWVMTGPADLHLFIQKVAAAGLFLNLRIGPYVCAEWSWGGYPYDIAQIPNITSRSSNPQWESWMRSLVLNVTEEFRPYFADRGGPIVLAQVENELHTSDTAYIDFCGELVDETGVKIPWEMCNGVSADNTINSCNGGDCTQFIEENGQNGKVLITQPALWTETWMGWFSSWGDSHPGGDWNDYDATSQSLSKSFGILRWFARGGSHINQYNWAGGNHFGRTAGSSLTGIYYWDAPIASDNLDQGVERLHISRTFAAIASVADIIVSFSAQNKNQIQVPYYDAAGSLQPGDSSHIGYIYGDVAFLENVGSAVATLLWRGNNYTVVNHASALVLSNGTILFASNDLLPFNKVRNWTPVVGAFSGAGWESWSDTLVPSTSAAIPPPTAPRTPWVGSALGVVRLSNTPLEAVAFSEYDSELVLYATSLSASTVSAAVAGSNGDATKVQVSLASAKAQGWAAFAAGALVGTVDELSHSGGADILKFTIDLSGINTKGGRGGVIAFLSSSLGIDNGGGVHNGSSTGVKGITSNVPGSITLGGVDITSNSNNWTHISGSVGEAKSVFTNAGGASVSWTPLTGDTTTTLPLTWLRRNFTAPASVLATGVGIEMNATLNLDVTGLSRGRFFINGMDLGRYWSKVCGSNECQRFYPIPFDLLLAGANANSLVILDELGITNVSAVTLAVAANVVPPPPPPCTIPSIGGTAGMFPCGSTGTALLTKLVGSGTQVSLTNAPGLCLSAASPTAVAFTSCNVADVTQSWVLPVEGAVTVAGTVKPCLDVFGMNVSVGAGCDMWACNKGSNQEWVFDGVELASQLTDQKLCVGLCQY